jgi:hypothetical protein
MIQKEEIDDVSRKSGRVCIILIISISFSCQSSCLSDGVKLIVICVMLLSGQQKVFVQKGNLFFPSTISAVKQQNASELAVVQKRLSSM